MPGDGRSLSCKSRSWLVTECFPSPGSRLAGQPTQRAGEAARSRWRPAGGWKHRLSRRMTHIWHAFIRIMSVLLTKAGSLRDETRISRRLFVILWRLQLNTRRLFTNTCRLQHHTRCLFTISCRLPSVRAVCLSTHRVCGATRGVCSPTNGVCSSTRDVCSQFAPFVYHLVT